MRFSEHVSEQIYMDEDFQPEISVFRSQAVFSRSETTVSRPQTETSSEVAFCPGEAVGFLSRNQLPPP